MQPVVQPAVQPVVNQENVCIHDTAGCTTGCIVYTQLKQTILWTTFLSQTVWVCLQTVWRS